MLATKNPFRQTGASDTPLKTQARLITRPDYIRVRGIVNNRVDFSQLVDWIVPIKEISVRKDRQYVIGTLAYDHSFAHVSNSVRGGYSYRDGGKVELCLDITGEVLSTMTTRDHWRLLQWLSRMEEFKCMRFDIAIDDPSKELIKIEDYESAIRKHEFARFKEWNILENSKRRKTVYVGSRRSNSFARVYLHDGVPRFETEFKGEQAKQVFTLLQGIDSPREAVLSGEVPVEQLEHDFQAMMGRLALGRFEFVERDKEEGRKKELGRCDRLPFWQKLIDAIGETIRITVPKVNPTIERKLAWFQRSIINSYRALLLAYGEKFPVVMQKMLERGKERWQPHHQAMVECFKREVSECAA